MNQSAWREARRLGQILGLASGIVALMQVVISASAAVDNAAGILTMQRALIDLSNGGGAVVTPVLRTLLPVFLVTYLSAFCAFMLALLIAWYAGRYATEATNQPEVGGSAGYWVMLVGGLVWIVASLLAVVLFHADGTISWLVASTGLVLAAPSSTPPTDIYITHPSAIFVALQIVILLIQLIIGFALGLGLGALAGRMGARSVRSRRAPLPPSPWHSSYPQSARY